MKVFSILLTTCLLGLCHCKRSKFITDRPVIEVLDDYTEDEVVSYHLIKGTRKNRSSGQRQVWDMASGTVYEAEYTQPSARRHTNDRRVEDVAAEESAEQDGVTLDLTSPDEDEYDSFDGNATRLVVPNKGLNFKKLVDGKRKVYTLPSGEKFDHANSYLNNDGKPELVILVAKISDSVMEHYLELKDGVWVYCKDKDVKMRSLVVTTKWEPDFELDLASTTNTDECTIFETELLGITTRHVYPKPGHLVKVTDGSSELWKAQPHFSRVGIKGRFGGPNDGYCLSCLVYKKGDKELMEMITVENLSERSRYFERVSTEWISVEKDSFLKKLDEMRSGS